MVIPGKLIARLTLLYTVVTLAMSTGAFLSLFIDFNSPGQAAEGSSVLKVFWGTVYAITALRVLTRRQRIGHALRANKPLIALVGLAVVSWLWSIDPPVTLHQSLGLIFGLLFAADFSVSYPLHRQLQIVCAALLSVVVLSVIVQIFFPSLVPGSDLEGTAWHGILGRKNEFGRLVCFAGIAVFTQVMNSRWKTFLTLAIAGALAFASRSTSAVIYLVVMFGVTKAWSMAFLRRGVARLAIGAVLCLATIGTIVITRNFDQLMYMIGKDPQLTGRTALWSQALVAISDRPLLGYGYQAFWVFDSQPARLVREAAGWRDAPHAHNGYIDLTLNVGFLGLLLYLASYAISIVKAREYLQAGSESYRRWPLSCLVLLCVYQLTETTIVTGNSFFWMVFCSLTISLSNEHEALALTSRNPRLAERDVCGRTSLESTY